MVLLRRESVLLTGAEAPVARHVAWGLRHAGHRVHVATHRHVWPGQYDAPPFVCHRLPCATRRPADMAHAVGELAEAFGFSSIIPCRTEGVALARWAGAALGRRLRMPSTEVLAQVGDPLGLHEVANHAGIKTPRTKVLRAGAWVGWYAGMDKTLLVPREGGAPVVAHPQAIHRRLEAQEGWCIQERVEGAVVHLAVLACAGRICGLVAYRERYGPWGRGAWMERVEDGMFWDLATCFVGVTHWDGFLGLRTVVAADGVCLVGCVPHVPQGAFFWCDGDALAHGLLGAQVTASGSRLVFPERMAGLGLVRAVCAGQGVQWSRDWAGAQNAHTIGAPMPWRGLVAGAALGLLEGRG